MAEPTPTADALALEGVDELTEWQAVTDRVRELAKAVPDTGDAKRRFIRDMIVEGIYAETRHAAVVAEVWGMEEKSVVNIGTECRRWLRAALGPEQQVRLREKLVVKTHDMLERVTAARDFESVGRIALPLAGVSSSSHVPSVVVVMMPGEVLRVPADGLARQALADARFGAALKALAEGKTPVIDVDGEAVSEDAPAEVQALEAEAGEGSDIAAMRVRAWRATDETEYARALVGVRSLLAMMEANPW